MIQPKVKALQKRRDESRTRIDQLHAAGYRVGWNDWEELGRCYYYLHDEQPSIYDKQPAWSSRIEQVF